MTKYGYIQRVYNIYGFPNNTCHQTTSYFVPFTYCNIITRVALPRNKSFKPYIKGYRMKTKQ